MTRNLFHTEQMLYTTARIECRLRDGGSSIGTGFFFQLLRGSNLNIPLLVTNVHVIRDSIGLRIRVRVRVRAKDADGMPNNRDQVVFDLNLNEGSLFKHPDSTLDLAALPVAGLLQEMINQGKHPYYISLSQRELPTEEQLDGLGAIENILMVGYPNGLWDETNNLPISRSGITATHPAIDYEGRPQFLIDAACFGGSSGSPVFYYNPGMTLQRTGNIAMGGPTVFLLEILYAGPTYTSEGEIVVVDVPTQITRIPSRRSQ